MGNHSKYVYDPTMAALRPATDFPVSLYGTPNPFHQEVFYTVLRAGHLRAVSGYGVRRDHFRGFEFIYVLDGTARVRVEGAWHEVQSGDLVFFDCHHPHEHSTGKQPWHAYWVRIEGPGLSRLASILAIHNAPIISGVSRPALMATYEEIFALMTSSGPDSPALLHAAVARLLALACCARQLPSLELGQHDVLRPAIEHLRENYFAPHRVADLAARAGLSPSHFTRLFRRAFGTSPIDWLRRERINQAKRRLIESRDPIEWIAEQVGYNDRFFFSKDFKRMTGLSPRDFRRRES